VLEFVLKNRYFGKKLVFYMLGHPWSVAASKGSSIRERIKNLISYYTRGEGAGGRDQGSAGSTPG
jgi:hypothetical protein